MILQIVRMRFYRKNSTELKIEIGQDNGRLVGVGADVDMAALQRILDALERR